MNFYIKPQLIAAIVAAFSVVSYWISTSNHNQELLTEEFAAVVSYWISTSNHNTPMLPLHFDSVVSYWISTSNHNQDSLLAYLGMLYLIEFLHQTTTDRIQHRGTTRLYLIEFLHQTTTAVPGFQYLPCCILLNFYIKPQLVAEIPEFAVVVSYWISTSNHNHRRERGFGGVVVSYWISTSNHNLYRKIKKRHELYLIEFLHQTTTRHVCTRWQD